MADVFFVVSKDFDIQGLDRLGKESGVVPLSVDPDDPAHGGHTLLVPGDPTVGVVTLFSPQDSNVRLDSSVFAQGPVNVIVVEPSRVLNAELLAGIVAQAVEADTLIRFHVMEEEPQS
jgi:hypothetical protein